MSDKLYLDFKVEGMALTRTSFPTIVEGSKQFIYARFSFSSEWTGTNIFMLIQKLDKTYTVDVSSGEGLITDDVTNDAGIISIGLVCKKSEQIITTNPVTITLKTTVFDPDTEQRLTTDYLASTLELVKQYAGNSSTSETNAIDSANAAAASATEADKAQAASEKAQAASEKAQTASENAQKIAESSRDTAVTKANEAKVSETNAAASEKNSKLSETNAAASEKNSKLSETNSHNSEANAKEYMESAEKSAKSTAESAEQCSKDVAAMDDFIESLTKLSKAPPLSKFDDAMVLVTPTLSML